MGDDVRKLTHLRRARDLMDREYAQPLDVPTIAARAFMSPAHFSRRFAAAYGETPHSYLMTRRIERAMALLRAGWTVTDACMAVGCTSLGSFSASFRDHRGDAQRLPSSGPLGGGRDAELPGPRRVPPGTEQDSRRIRAQGSVVSRP
jgi:AraC-like DNA-binding protein